MKKTQAILFFCIMLAVLGYFLGGGEALLNPQAYKTLFQHSPITTALIFFTVYVLGAALSLPVMVTLSIISGLIFGHVVGLVLALFACTTGATGAYLFSRHLLRDWVHRRFSAQFERVNQGVEKDGVLYLFCVRMMPVIPFWLVNLALGPTVMRVTQFYLATLAGMLPITFILVNFGAQLGNVESFSISELWSPGLLLSLVLLAILPIISRAAIRFISGRRKNLAE